MGRSIAREGGSGRRCHQGPTCQIQSAQLYLAQVTASPWPELRHGHWRTHGPAIKEREESSRRTDIFAEDSMAKHSLRVGLIGAGANTRLRHIPGLRVIP